MNNTTNQNNSAQPGLTDDLKDAVDILRALRGYLKSHRINGPTMLCTDGQALNNADDEVLRALKLLVPLSALRAPVADERAAFEAAWRELNSPWPMNSRMHDDGRYATPDIEREWRLWQARAALASAPVADKRQLRHERRLRRMLCAQYAGAAAYMDDGEAQDARAMPVIDFLRDPVDEIERKMRSRADAALARAPVAGEAQEHYAEVKATLEGAHRIMEGVAAVERRAGPIGSHARGYTHKITNALSHLDKLYAAPQASEAVRIQFPAHLRKMWSGGEVQAWLDGHQGVTPPKVSAKGSLERYRKWQAEREEAFGAGVKAAADLVKKMVDDYDTDHGSTDPETGTREYPGDGAAWVCDMEELEGSIRALSAQPGAQKTGGSDAN